MSLRQCSRQTVPAAAAFSGKARTALVSMRRNRSPLKSPLPLFYYRATLLLDNRNRTQKWDEFEVEERANTEWMSTNGNVPVLVEGATNRVYFGCKEIQETLKKKEISHLLAPDDAQLENKLVNLLDILKRVELYHSWVDPTTLLNVTKKRYTSEVDVYSVFKKFVFKNRRENVLKFLSVHNWHIMSSKDVLREFDNVLSVFSELLGEKKYLFGERLSDFDCLLFGHLYAILTTKYMGTFGGDLQQTIAKYQNLIDHTKEIDRLSKIL